MYAVAKEHRSSKLLFKARPALSQKIDKSFDQPLIKKDDIQLNDICTINKTLINSKSFRASRQHAPEEISAQHEAMIRYIDDSWRRIQQELEYSNKVVNGSVTNSDSNGVAHNGTNGSVVMNQSKIKHIQGTSSIPKNFVPFDLESFWGQRIYQSLLQSS